ncbi:hypothetical protein DUNSADRAFT_13561 [Dunaliella salina]|uniref:Transmembrane protein n=1 Tax=Dunaliella salina TaxID=3046 RepID=A0ABQ7H3C3_DUNSA|nr:hypothetical protein DUNSADRAFT_13561 [Dunaliella salina]|eukprot:KAF5841288.1 hypothetical protein DUNSADRAFT_13561 [Dunaliella salina]
MPGVGTFSAPQLFSAPSNFVASSVSQPSGAPNPLVPPTLWCPQHSGAPQPFGAPIAPQPYGGLQPSGAPQTFGAPSASQPFGAPQSFGAPSAPQPFLATSISSTPPLASGTGLFGPAPSFGPSGSTSVPGSRIVPFQMTVQRDGTAGNETMGNYMSITAMPEYTNKSVEELRSEDYQANARCGPWVGPIPLRQLAASSLSEAPGPSNQSRAREPNQSRARQLSQSRTRAQDSVVFMQALPGESDIEFANRLAFTLSGRAPTSSRPSLPSGRPPPASQPSMPSQGVPPSSRLSLPSHGVPPSSQPLLHTGTSSSAFTAYPRRSQNTQKSRREGKAAEAGASYLRAQATVLWIKHARESRGGALGAISIMCFLLLLCFRKLLCPYLRCKPDDTWCMKVAQTAHVEMHH